MNMTCEEYRATISDSSSGVRCELFYGSSLAYTAKHSYLIFIQVIELLVKSCFCLGLDLCDIMLQIMSLWY